MVIFQWARRVVHINRNAVSGRDCDLDLTGYCDEGKPELIASTRDVASKGLVIKEIGITCTVSA